MDGSQQLSCELCDQCWAWLSQQRLDQRWPGTRSGATRRARSVRRGVRGGVTRGGGAEVGPETQSRDGGDTGHGIKNAEGKEA